jgi:hypothetical protein
MLGARERMVEVELVPMVKEGATERMVAEVPEATPIMEAIEVEPVAETAKKGLPELEAMLKIGRTWELEEAWTTKVA